LKALAPLWMPWVRKCFRVDGKVERQLQRISACQIQCRLFACKEQLIVGDCGGNLIMSELFAENG